MADFLSHLFDTDRRQRDDLDDTREAVDDARLDLATLRGELSAARGRIHRLERVLEGLVTLLETRGDLDRDELTRFVSGVDPAAGRADDAPRGRCVVCGLETEAAVLVQDPDGPTCVGCHLAG